jgi:hypothetical protein
MVFRLAEVPLWRATVGVRETIGSRLWQSPRWDSKTDQNRSGSRSRFGAKTGNFSAHFLALQIGWTEVVRPRSGSGYSACTGSSKNMPILRNFL